MRRRDFGKVSLSLMASTMLSDSAKGAGGGSGSDFPKTPGLTKYVAEFVLATKYQDIPQEVIELGKKSILDGLGLALAGSRAESGPISRKYVENLGIRDGKATIIGSAQKTSPRLRRHATRRRKGPRVWLTDASHRAGSSFASCAR